MTSGVFEQVGEDLVHLAVIAQGGWQLVRKFEEDWMRCQESLERFDEPDIVAEHGHDARQDCRAPPQRVAARMAGTKYSSIAEVGGTTVSAMPTTPRARAVTAADRACSPRS